MNPTWAKVRNGLARWERLKFDWGEITLEARPPYCDRGNFIAKVFITPGRTHYRGTDSPWLDYQDGWPRYYFDEGRAKEEIKAWLIKRKLIS